MNITMVMVKCNENVMANIMSKQRRSRITKSGVSGMQIYIPADVRKDSQNPFKVGDEVIVKIDKGTLVIEPAGRGQGAVK